MSGVFILFFCDEESRGIHRYESEREGQPGAYEAGEHFETFLNNHGNQKDIHKDGKSCKDNCRGQRRCKMKLFKIKERNQHQEDGGTDGVYDQCGLEGRYCPSTHHEPAA